MYSSDRVHGQSPKLTSHTLFDIRRLMQALRWERTALCVSMHLDCSHEFSDRRSVRLEEVDTPKDVETTNVKLAVYMARRKNDDLMIHGEAWYYQGITDRRYTVRWENDEVLTVVNELGREKKAEAGDSGEEYKAFKGCATSYVHMINISTRQIPSELQPSR